MLPEHLTESQELRRRFDREARAICKLQHPHVCTLHDVGSERGIDYLVMEHLEGETLEARLRRGALPAAEVLEIGRQVAGAIEAAHRRGIVPRDLKPGNVMLTPTGAKVLDFGLARELLPREATADTRAETLTAALTEEGTLAGTLPYMAPEQLQGKPADARTDVWALGCVLYETATGSRPFRGESQADLIGSIMSASPEPPTRRQPLAPERLDWVVARCLEKDPERRWQSARDVAIELEAIAAAASAPRSAVATATTRTDRRRLLPGWVLPAIAVLLVGASAWWLWNRSPGVTGSSAPGLREVKLGVLPFENFTTEPELDQLAIGIADDVITRLAGTREVATRKASFDQRGKGVCNAAREIGALVMLHGSVRRLSEDALRVSAQYIRCPQEDHLWAETFDLEDERLPVAQDEIASFVAGAANLVMWEADRTTPGLPYWHLMQLSEGNNASALEIWRARVERDPADVQAHIGIYWAHMQRLTEGFFDESPARSIAAMERAAQACLSLRPSYWLCYQATGHVARFRGEREKMLAAAKRVVELSGDLSLDIFYARALADASRGQEALQALEDLVERRGGGDLFPGEFATAHFAAGNYAEAVRYARQIALTGVNLSPLNDLAFAHQMLAASYGRLGETALAQDALAEAKRLRPLLSAERVAILLAAAEPEHRERYLDGLRRAGLGD